MSERDIRFLPDRTNGLDVENSFRPTCETMGLLTSVLTSVAKETTPGLSSLLNNLQVEKA
jgi:hypothetical protein